VLLALAATQPSTVRAADNTATGDIAGVDANLDDSNTFTINTTTLALVKAAFLADGTQLISGANVPGGTRVRFLVYVDNPTPTTVLDVNVQDALAAGFAYVAGTLRSDASQATGTAEAALYAAAQGTAPLTDANDGDVAGISGATVTAGATGGNAQLDIAAGTVWAMVFEVTVL
jgi:uncharacterized repeat protein (TIGR01451 family)